MTNKKKKTMATVLIMAVVVVTIAVAFWQIMQKRHAQQDASDGKQSEIQTLLDMDFTNDYPGTPREVIKVYSRITSCLYNQSMSDEKQEALVEKMRELFDEELKNSNPQKDQMEDLRADIKEYKKAKRSISSYMIEKNSSVVKQKVKEKECASLYASYLLQEGSAYKKSTEKFLLCKDKKGKWKILGWELVSANDKDK